jgi:hypothetical protein
MQTTRYPDTENGCLWLSRECKRKHSRRGHETCHFFIRKTYAISDYEMKLDAIGVGESHDPSLSSKISALCKEESWSDMSQPGHAAPLTLD